MNPMVLMGIPNADLDKPIYRIVSFERLLELFCTQKNTLVKPKLWQDVFENFILRSRVRLLSGQIIEYNFHDRMYGQCWTLEEASDAMWRIYSSDQRGLRIRTTIRKLAEGLPAAQVDLAHARIRVGRVEYLSDKELWQVANATFDDSGIGCEELFRSLLVKKRAFRHENEVRALYHEFDDDSLSRDLHKYEIDPHALVEQITVDPRRSETEFQDLEKIIRQCTGFRGEIVRSTLYTLPRDIVLDVKDVLLNGSA